MQCGLNDTAQSKLTEETLSPDNLKRLCWHQFSSDRYDIPGQFPNGGVVAPVLRLAQHLQPKRLNPKVGSVDLLPSNLTR